MALESKLLFHPEVTWVGEVKRIRGKKLPLGAARFHALRDAAGRTLFPLPIKWIAARVRIGPSKGAKSVLHR